MDNWISVKEDLPDKSDEFLIAEDYKGQKLIYIHNYDLKTKTFFTDIRDEDVINEDVTHWQPLPELPIIPVDPFKNMKTGKQPCSDFKASILWEEKKCDLCKKSIVLCDNCSHGHHADGYGDCDSAVWVFGRFYEGERVSVKDIKG